MSKKRKQIPSVAPKFKQGNLARDLLAQGFGLHQKGDLVGAGEFYSKILKLEPLNFDALHLSGLIAATDKRLDVAEQLITRAISVNPHDVSAHFNLANVYLNSAQYENAIEIYSRALKINPNYVEAFYSRGLTHQKFSYLNDAKNDYERALSINPKHIGALTNLGNVFQMQKKFEDAIGCYESAIALNLSIPEPFNNRGNLLHVQRRYQAALEDFEKALALNPNYPEAINNRANTLFELKLYDDAINSYNSAIAIKPDYAEAFHNRGNLFRELKKYDLAKQDYQVALALKPNYEYLRGLHFACKMNICDWSNLSEEWSEIECLINNSERVISPFLTIPVSDSMAIQRKAAEIWVAEKFQPQPQPIFSNKPLGQRKIRIGYFSGDFHDHATMYLMAEIFELHDKNKFEIIGFSFGIDRHDEMRKRALNSFDKFYDVRNSDDRSVAQFARELEIDIAIDLKGYTLDSRTGIFSHRAAPIQINYLGYPGTMGADFIDYIIADEVVIPKEMRSQYSEKVLYLPHSYQPNDRKRKISDRNLSRHELGLPDEAFVFCSFNANYKITPSVFDVWMRILHAVEGSVLWLLGENVSSIANLQKEAKMRGIDPNRIIFAQPFELPDHLARHQMADLFLDTWPCNAHTTASDSLWAGLPVLTMPGQSFASRVAASLVTAVDLPELIASSPQEYESMAIMFGQNADRVGEIKQRLHESTSNSLLFDAQSFTRNLENLYIEIVSMNETLFTQ